MSFPVRMASVLSGATPSQLTLWRSNALVVPEVRAERPPLYSFRDIVLLRTLAYLRSQVSAQKIRRSFDNLQYLADPPGADAALVAGVDHPSEYQFGTDGRTVYVGLPDGETFDLLHKVHPGGAQPMVFPFEVMLGTFANFRGDAVAPLAHPARHIVVDQHRLGGWPTIEGTRIQFDTIAQLVDHRTVHPEDVDHYFPGITADQARGAVDLADRINAVRAA